MEISLLQAKSMDTCIRLVDFFSSEFVSTTTEFARVIFDGILIPLLINMVVATMAAYSPPCGFKAIYNFGNLNSKTGAISAVGFPDNGQMMKLSSKNQLEESVMAEL
ncbi:hypothetical protein V6N13_001033 [Hibiscus sabdariffa]|uniref:Uncharacterized protein n=1 Tax=Hibiscus sabdariffa TaxID=183260 RepID=A0ABR2G820_9ROSI